MASFRVTSGALVLLLGLLNVNAFQPARQSTHLHQMLNPQTPAMTPAQPGVPPNPNQPSNVRINYMPPCQYLSSRPSRRLENACPFEIETYNGQGPLRVERGKPVQVTIKPWENSPYMFENFTDFIVFAIPSAGGPPDPAMPTAMPHRPVGVFDTDPRYSKWASGAKGFKCNKGSLGHDAVGSIEEYTLELYKLLFPQDVNLQRYTPRQRVSGMYLWYPTEACFESPAITFVAKINIRGEWCTLTSPSWPVYNPPSPQQVRQQEMAKFTQMQQEIVRLEQQVRAAEAQQPAAKK